MIKKQHLSAMLQLANAVALFASFGLLAVSVQTANKNCDQTFECNLSAYYFICLQILVFQYVNLSINYEGMESMSFFLEGGKLKFLQESDLAYVRPMDGTLGGYLNENLLFEGDKQIVSNEDFHSYLTLLRNP